LGGLGAEFDIQDPADDHDDADAHDGGERLVVDRRGQ
jgi:hypothetical protein